MSGADWLSYSLQDFLMFGPQVFLRLFVRLNQDAWPWQLWILPLTLSVPWLICQPKRALRRTALVVVAAAWTVSGSGFLLGYFGEINWPARWFGWAFLLQGLVLAVLAVLRDCPPVSGRRAGWLAAFWLVAVVLLPWVTVIQSGEMKALALFGLAPGVTVAASGLLLAVPGRPWRAAGWLLLPVPVCWVLFCAATYWVLQTYWLLLGPAAALIFMGVGLWLSPNPGQSRGLQSVRHDPVRR